MQFSRESIIKSTIYKAFSILSKNEKKKLIVVMSFQILLGLLDLIGVALIGMLGALTVNGIQSRKPGTRILSLLSFMNIENMSFQAQVSIIGAIAAFLLIVKTVISILVIRRILRFMSNRAAVTSSNLIERLLEQDITKIQKRSNQETLFAVTTGVNSITIGVLASVVTMLSDLSLLLILGSGLIYVNSIIALFTFIYFGLIGYNLYKLMHKRAHKLGLDSSRLNVYSSEKILEVLNSYREITVRNRRKYYATIIAISRLNIAKNTSEIAFQPNIGKYVIETSLVLGSLAICAIQFALNDATHAIATLTIFLAAGTRIAPAVLRIQQGLVTIRNSLGVATPTLELMDSLAPVLETARYKDIPVQFDHDNFDGSVLVQNLFFSYSESTQDVLRNVNLEIMPGSFAAIVGPSGAGKTTLVDLILGILDQKSGKVLISGVSPKAAITEFSGAIAYMPQDILIIDGTIKENIALGFPVDEIDDERIWNALKFANLDQFVSTLKEGIYSKVGERGSKLSGGQRQRIGIARAMFTVPKLLILDEATSSLDTETESEITQSLRDLKGKVTILVIAHRLSTIRNADKLYYMQNGEILYSGTFEEVKNNVKSFANQARLSGL